MTSTKRADGGARAVKGAENAERARGVETPVLSLLALLVQKVLRLVPEIAERARGVETQVHPLVLPSTHFTCFTSTKGARAPYLSKGGHQRVYRACTRFTCFTSTKGAEIGTC